MKYLIPFLVVICLFNACNKKENKNEILVKQYFDYFNNHEWNNMANMYIDSAEFKDPTLGNEIVKQTRKQIIEKYSALHAIFPNLKDEIVTTYKCGDNQMVVEFTSSGKAADNSNFELPICTIFTFKNGYITKDFTYFDNFEEQ